MDDASVNLVERWRAGDERAATELFQRYAERLVGLARRRLPSQLSSHVDPEDVVQSVYRSFFAAAREGRYALEQSGDLWRLLTTITLNKVQHQWRRHSCVKRGGSSRVLDERAIEVLSREPSAEECVVLGDLLAQTLATFEPMHRRVVELRLQGYPQEEIATEAGLSSRTVRRILERFKAELDRLAELGDDLAPESPSEEAP